MKHYAESAGNPINPLTADAAVALKQLRRMPMLNRYDIVICLVDLKGKNQGVGASFAEDTPVSHYFAETGAHLALCLRKMLQNSTAPGVWEAIREELLKGSAQ